MAKRLFDLTFVVLGLLLLAGPGLLVALAIKLDSRGPVFFRQERVGCEGRLFRIYKFRTMGIDAERLGGQLTVGADPRITRVGRWLRESKFDELPQLLNVLVGDMSIVGPRPEVPRYVAMYPAALKMRALSVRPGITDPASLRFANESALLAQSSDPERTYIEIVMPAKLHEAVAYAETATLRSDLVLLCRSVMLLIGRRPAK